jgi:hypothetical protein
LTGPAKIQALEANYNRDVGDLNARERSEDLYFEPKLRAELKRVMEENQAISQPGFDDSLYTWAEKDFLESAMELSHKRDGAADQSSRQ